jgi:putative DNA primase/helicase
MRIADIEAQFLEAAANRGIIIRKIIADGRFHRCDAEGKNGRGDASYRLILDDNFPVGFLQNFRDGLGCETWRPSGGVAISPTQIAEVKAKIARQARERETERARAQAAAARRALEMIQAAHPADPLHPYLQLKHVKPHGIFQLGDALLIPMRDAAGAVWNVQRIFPDAKKRYLRDGRKKGLFFVIGKLDRRTVAVVEGFATAASVRQATELPVLVAFDAGNLVHVAAAMRKNPDTFLIFAADDDHLTIGNPGLTKATEAAQSVGNAAVVLPDFGADRGERDTDFNDLASRYGLAAVRKQIQDGLVGTGSTF